ncbi:MAG TPA: glycoside hydrolase [Chitinophagaceae bacterium]|nr:glycoside hydrolase [Chitinophagaceae bacterium]
MERPSTSIQIQINETKTAQTIHNFAASDAWSCQFVGNWPEEKRNAIADLLFSMDTLANGNPKGIGLSMWRYNIGAGSANQGNASGINDEWRRAASLVDNTQLSLVQAQNWFLSAAKERGVKQFLAFYNSPPVELTNNKKAFATNGVCNIDDDNYSMFAKHATSSIKQIESNTGIRFNFLSPVNEPQWDWSDGGQEGCPYTNTEISNLVKSFDIELTGQHSDVKILLPEAGHLKYSLSNSDKLNKDNQVNAFFDPASPQYIGNLVTVYPAMAAHSYFSTSPSNEAIDLRKRVNDAIRAKNGLQFWQSEYCILGDNAGEINGSNRDLGMSSALYVAKVIQQDLVWLNASAWQWWLAVSPYDYKDGLIYIDKSKTNGSYYDSKLLWIMGNYSRFIRPGMIRIESSVDDNDLLVSSFKDATSGKPVLVIVNLAAIDKPATLKKENNMIFQSQQLVTYTTDESRNLEKRIIKASDLVIPARSVMTMIVD